MRLQLQFVRAAGLTSAAIGYFGGGRFSHVDYRLATGSLYGSRSDWKGGRPPGVQLRQKDYAKWSLLVRMDLEVSSEQLDRFESFLWTQVGRPYDSPAIWGFALGRNWREPDSWFCSELQAAALEHARICPCLFFPSNKITPGGLAAIYSALGAKVVEQRISGLPVAKIA